MRRVLLSVILNSRMYGYVSLREQARIPSRNCKFRSAFPRTLKLPPAGLGAQPGPRVCILGGGFGGLYTAVRLDQLIWPREARPQVTRPSACPPYIALPGAVPSIVLMSPPGAFSQCSGPQCSGLQRCKVHAAIFHDPDPDPDPDIHPQCHLLCSRVIKCVSSTRPVFMGAA